jgi:flagellar motor switch/type III secretory pathway protein FliN
MTNAVELSQQSVALFSDLKTFSRAEVELVNWHRRTFGGNWNWEAWLRDAFSGLLEVPQGTRLRISQSNEIGSEQKREYRFDQNEIHIGRSNENDISLALTAVSRRHARIVLRGSEYYIEDLGSPTGTYLNDTKLNAHQPQLLSDGDRVLIFPYAFLVAVEEIWVPDEHLQFSQTFVTGADWSKFELGIPSGFARFSVEIHPDAGEAFIGVSRAFLQTIVSRMTREVTTELAASDSGIFEFLLTTVLEHANRELKFPFQLLLKPFTPPTADSGPGLALEFAIGISGATGPFKVFLPRTSLLRMRNVFAPSAKPSVDRPVVWTLPICAGYVTLAASDLGDIASGDILLYTPATEVLLPTQPGKGAGERGWQATQISDQPCRLELSKFFERSLFMAESRETEKKGELAPKPDIDSLPVRVHIVLSDVELSLGELDGLVDGSILELNCSKGDPVRLVVNGKPLGVGELIEVEGKLGVQITAWSARE